MILQFDDWSLDVDIDATMKYAVQEAAGHCDCAYCRNFYAAVDDHYPELRPFLAQFGLDLEAPDELMPYDVEDRMYYTGIYMVSGRILKAGREAIPLGNLKIDLNDEESIPINHGCPKPCFALEIDAIVLPWVLEEPMKEVVSPANLPSFLKKMWQKLMGRVKSKSVMS